jgi:hypothetical protein
MGLTHFYYTENVIILLFITIRFYCNRKKMAWRSFKQKQRENPKEDSVHKSKIKMQRETVIKIGVTGQERCHKEGKTWETTLRRRRRCRKTDTDGEA